MTDIVLSRPRPTRRGFLAGGGAAALLAGCASPFPTAEAEAAYPPIGRLIRADGHVVHVWEGRPDDPALAAATPAVLIHGASGNLRDWTFGIAQRIAATRPVLAFDRPGFGYSERAKVDGWSPFAQARIMRAAARDLGAERPIVVGHSLGAAVALAWALDAPEEVAGVVPVSGVTMPYTGMGRVFAALGLTSALAWVYTEYMKRTAESGGIDRFIERVFRPQTPPEGYADYVGAPLALRDGTLVANADDIERLNGVLREMAPRYPSLTMPVEIIHGEADFIDWEQQAGPLAEVLPDARLTVLPGIGHMAHHVATDVLIDSLDHIDEVLGA